MAYSYAGYIAFILLAIFLSLPELCWGQINSTSNGRPKIKLQGEVAHVDAMPPVHSQMLVGEIFDLNKIDLPPPTQVWYTVPSWLAGSWVYNVEKTVSYRNYKTGEIDMTPVSRKWYGTESFGSQRDRTGAVWDVIDTPFLDKSDRIDQINSDFHTQASIIRDTNSSFVEHLVFMRTVVDKATNRVTDIHQVEQISQYFPYGKDQVMSINSMKSFNRGGQPIELFESESIGKRTAPFVQVNHSTNIKEDLRSLFSRFLTSHGMGNLVPTDQQGR